ncbi:hypothetical protein [Kitasatospora sp. NPDC097643]|uniref:hypothetical protein n=1 Tax=Kitasatospora sp. NPDC097643 TaxID=3157230 RepID=UPI00332591DD
MLRRLLIAALLLAVLAATGAADDDRPPPPRAAASPEASPTPTPTAELPSAMTTVPPGTTEPSGPLLERARALTAAWSGSDTQRLWRTGYFPRSTKELFGPAAGYDSRNDREALAYYRLDLPAEAVEVPATGEVVWPDGSRATLPLLDPATALRSPYSRDLCPSDPCGRLTVTAVRLATRPQLTSRGEATIPVWELTTAGHETPLAVAAVAASEPRFLRNAPDWHGIPLASVLESGSTEQRLEGLFLLEGCEQLLPGEVYETAEVVVLIGHIAPARRAGCETEESRTVVGAFRLARPLGDRVVLNLALWTPEVLDHSWRR